MLLVVRFGNCFVFYLVASSVRQAAPKRLLTGARASTTLMAGSNRAPDSIRSAMRAIHGFGADGKTGCEKWPASKLSPSESVGLHRVPGSIRINQWMAQCGSTGSRNLMERN